MKICNCIDQREIDIHIDQWFNANMCAVLGAIINQLKDKGLTVSVTPGPASEIFSKNGFVKIIDSSAEILPDTHGTTIPYREYRAKSKEDKKFAGDINDIWSLCMKEFNFTDETLKISFLESLSEIFTNSKTHSGSDKIYTCGQYYPTKQIIEFTIADSGIGIQSSVNSYLKKMNQEQLIASDAIEWALQEGNTTMDTADTPGGLGLSVLFDFMQENGGKMQIVANDGYWCLENKNITKWNLDEAFKGTIVNIAIHMKDENEERRINTSGGEQNEHNHD